MKLSSASTEFKRAFKHCLSATNPNLEAIEDSSWTTDSNFVKRSVKVGVPEINQMGKIYTYPIKKITLINGVLFIYKYSV